MKSVNFFIVVCIFMNKYEMSTSSEFYNIILLEFIATKQVHNKTTPMLNNVIMRTKWKFSDKTFPCST